MSSRFLTPALFWLSFLGLVFLSLESVAQSPECRNALDREQRQYPRPETELPIPVEHERIHRADCFYGVAEFIAWGPVQMPEDYPCLPAEKPEVCPYLRQLTAKSCKSADCEKPERRTPLDNLQKLQLANAVYELGRFSDCMQCLWIPDLCYVAACQIAPGSRFEELAIRRLENSAIARFIPIYSCSDPNARMTELINQSEDLRQVQLEWARFWFEDHPSDPVLQACPALVPSPPVAVAPVPKRESKTRQVQLNVVIAEVPRGRFLKEDHQVKVLKPAAREKLVGRIQELRDEGKAKLLAEPRLVTTSGRSASFLDGSERAVETRVGLDQVGVEFEEFGTKLTVKPTVMARGKLQLEIEPEISQFDPAAGTTVNGVLVPGRTTQRMHVTFELKDGQTVAIGGLPATHAEGKKAKKYETVILVTPRIVRPDRNEAAASGSSR